MNTGKEGMSEWLWDVARSSAVLMLPTGFNVVLSAVYIGSHARQTYDTAVWMNDWVRWARGARGAPRPPPEEWMWVEQHEEDEPETFELL